ncbi:MAG: glycoside hydrolase family 5 protein [Prochloraceae cyanobacterium]|nr:glycoside hydrolase family 5 protein [Prochloraceae cyanobacterium]
MNSDKFGKKIRGVNLGGWLLLEKWMTPSLFKGLQATDETRWCLELGKEEATKQLKKHWESFITEEDFKWLSQVGINAVRIPVAFWLFGPPYPDHKIYEGKEPFVEGGDKYLDRAFEWAKKYGIYIVLDLHAAPGCQNGFDNGGMQGVIDWHTKEEYIQFSLEFLEKLAKRYGQHPNLIGIETLNEPHGYKIPNPLDILKSYNREAYKRIRKHCDKHEVAVIFHDAFLPHTNYRGDFQEPEYTNVIYDTHCYQVFGEHYKNWDIYGHIQEAAINRKNQVDKIITELNLWVCVGEWSLGFPPPIDPNRPVVDPNIFSIWNQQGPNGYVRQDMDEFQKNVAYRAYGAAQLASFERCLSWFFWSYKIEETETEARASWSFRDCVERGWLPDKYN